jgi:hypothetical protein
MYYDNEYQITQLDLMFEDITISCSQKTSLFSIILIVSIVIFWIFKLLFIPVMKSSQLFCCHVKDFNILHNSVQNNLTRKDRL